MINRLFKKGKMMLSKRIVSVVLVIVTLLVFQTFSSAEGFVSNDDIPSEYLCDLATGTVMFEKDEDTRRPLASVTKIMTMLLVFEAAERGDITLDDEVTVSARSSNMGGSQVYLKEGECFPVRELLKCVAVASANDACVALAEYVCGSEETFVERMNERAGQLGMVNTHFENTNGLDDTATEHYSSAHDIAVMSRELMKHNEVFEFTTIWTDTFRNGTFGLTNTNKLIRFYSGANGLKTGSTSKARYCISATACRDGTQLIAVIMGAPTSDVRNAEAKHLLDYGFANYSNVHIEAQIPQAIAVKRGIDDKSRLSVAPFEYLLKKSDASDVETTVDIPEYLTAPVRNGGRVGEAIFTLHGEEIGRVPIVSTDNVPRIGYMGLLNKLICNFLGA